MSGTQLERFRITAWPGAVLPPPCARTSGYQLEGGVLLPLEWVPLAAGMESGELYLRLVAVDLNDPDEILRFVNDVNILGFYDTLDSWHSFATPLEVERAVRASRRRAGRVLVDEFRRDWEAQEPDKRPLWESLPEADTNPRIAAFNVFDIETLDEFRIGANLIRDGLTAWRYLRGDLVAGDVRWESLYFESHEREQIGHVSVHAQDLLATLFDMGLIVFHPTVFIDTDESTESSDRVTVLTGSVLSKPSRLAPHLPALLPGALQPHRSTGRVPYLRE